MIQHCRRITVYCNGQMFLTNQMDGPIISTQMPIFYLNSFNQYKTYKNIKCLKSISIKRVSITCINIQRDVLITIFLIAHNSIMTHPKTEMSFHFRNIYFNWQNSYECISAIFDVYRATHNS